MPSSRSLTFNDPHEYLTAIHAVNGVEIAASFMSYIGPHVDMGLAKQVMDKDRLPPESKEPLQGYMNA